MSTDPGWRIEPWHFEGHRVRLYRLGRGPTLVLLHGIGPGTSIAANFEAVAAPLAARFSLVGMDWIGFGGSSAKPAPPYFDPALWDRQGRALLSRLGPEPVRLWGQSIGGALALRLAAAMPSSVSAVVTTGSGGGRHRLNPALDQFWTLPDEVAEMSVAAMMAALRTGVHDPALISEALARQRLNTLVDHGAGDVFRTMMATDRQTLLDQVAVPPADLRAVTARVLMIHGRDDAPVPAEENSLYLQRFIPRCDTVLLGDCGHNPMLERTGQVLTLALDHLLARVNADASV